MEEKEEHEIQEALEQGFEQMEFEPIPTEQSSPLNAPVKQGEVGEGVVNLSRPPQQVAYASVEAPESIRSESDRVEEAPPEMDFEEPLDAPEQEIGEDYNEPHQDEGHEGLEAMDGLDEHIDMNADSFLGMANHLLEMGASPFVKVKKPKEVLNSRRASNRIDEQNQRNIDRLKITDEDKAIIKPALKAVMKKRAKALTPEQLLMAWGVSYLARTATMIPEIRKENKLLHEAILEDLRAEKATDRTSSENEHKNSRTAQSTQNANADDSRAASNAAEEVDAEDFDEERNAA